MSKSMDDGSFMLGGVFSAQLSAKLRISGKNVNSYTIIGAKIIVYVWLPLIFKELILHILSPL